MFLVLQVMAHHAVACHAVVVTKAGAIKKTTSGKVQRRACRAAFMAGEYSQVCGVPCCCKGNGRLGFTCSGSFNHGSPPP